MEIQIIEQLADMFVGVVCGSTILCAVLDPVAKKVLHFFVS